MIEKIAKLTPGVIPYLESGKGLNLLFFHGAFAMPQAYVSLLNLLAKKFHVIAPTHPGHGEAFSIPESWVMEDLLKVYHEFISSLDIKPDILVGHSFGGTVAILLSRYYPGVKIVALDAPGFPILASEMDDYVKAMFEEGMEVLQKQPDLDYLQDVAKATRTIFRTIVKHPEDIPIFYRYGPTLDISEDIKHIKSPISLIWGESDKIVPLSEGIKIHELLENSTLGVLPGFKHNYPVTHPEITYQKIIAALS